jgi:hypothetical protein
MATLARALDADRGGAVPLRALARRLLMLTAIPCALAVAGCSSVFVVRDVTAYATAPASHRRAELRLHRFQALLAPQPPPDCEFKSSDAGVLDTDLWARLKLDYERHCYQRAETVVRARLRQLQASGLCEIEPPRHRRRFIR